MERWGAELYGDPCRECGFDWATTPKDAVRWVCGFVAGVEEATDAVTGDERGAAWSIAEYVSHVGDNLRQWAERVQAARLTGRVRIAGYDPDRLAEARGYGAIPLPVALWSTGVAAEQWAEVMTSALDEGVVLHHDERGAQRAEDIARNNCHDAYHHLADIHRLADRRST